MRPQKAKVISGAEAMASAYELAGVRIAYTFPITPQSEVMEYLAAREEITCIQADCEYNVLAGAEGVLWSGERCAVATASQGLVLMSEVMWEVAGNRLPLVMGVFNRGLKGPGWCLGSQQNDALFMRDTGWMQFYCESAQQLLDMTLIAFRVAEEILLPAMVIGDGFYLSHEREEVWVPEAEDVEAFLGRPGNADLPRAGHPANYAGLAPPETYHRLSKAMHEDIERVVDLFPQVAAEFESTFGRGHSLLDAFDVEDAEVVVVTAGTISGTAHEAIEGLRSGGERVGLLRLNCFRPFPARQLVEVLPPNAVLAVLDRNLAPGTGGIFGANVKIALHGNGAQPVFTFVTGLGGMDVSPDMVRMAVDYARDHRGARPSIVFLTEAGVEECGSNGQVVER